MDSARPELSPISAHWYLPVTLVTGSNAPRTIPDFGGFPRTLYECEYPAPDDRVLAQHEFDFTNLGSLLTNKISGIIELQIMTDGDCTNRLT